MLNLAIIGLGYWGPNYLRIFKELDATKVKTCCDLDKNNLKKAKDIYPDIELCEDYLKIAKDSTIDAVVIITPLNTHYDIAKACLEKGKHVLIEKPFTANSQQALELIELAQKKSLVLSVGHVFEHNSGVKKLKEIVKEDIGEVYYVSAERFGLGPIRKYANALWDLATHDISIAIFLLEKLPESVFCKGMHYIQDNVEDIIFLSMNFPNNIIYNIHASWLAPEKIRKTTIVGSNCMSVYDDVNKHEMIKVYERTINKALIGSTPEYKDHQLVIHVGDVTTPKVEQSEPLKNLVIDFIDSIIDKRKPKVDGYSGLRVVKVLEAAEKSLKSKDGDIKVVG